MNSNFRELSKASSGATKVAHKRSRKSRDVIATGHMVVVDVKLDEESKKKVDRTGRFPYNTF